jgi:hypothetical protein
VILIYIREADIEAYTAQGWQCVRLQGHHGARRGSHMRTFMAALPA